MSNATNISFACQTAIMRSTTLLPLHSGRAPRWLFSRMVMLGEKISQAIIDEYGPDELVARLADSNWFQALACALGYDWHSSGVTTVTMGALKMALKESPDIAIAGGKGKAGTNTPIDIEAGAERLSMLGAAQKLTEYSRLSAKVDAAMVYDNVSIYQHSFIFSKSSKWTVVQQGMEQNGTMAVRFQWFSDLVENDDFAREPHSGMGSSTAKSKETMDLTYDGNTWARRGLVETLEELHSAPAGVMSVVHAYPKRHEIMPALDITKRGAEALKKAYELEPKDYRELLLVKGVGRKTLKSLALVASLIYDKELAMRDPVLYAYNVGGKDGIPYKISREHYDKLIESLSLTIDRANIESEERRKALKRLSDSIAQKSLH
ncbi:MAG: DUF763 domain-containing protein [Candidatus Micrarchaeia archaeon]